MQGFAVRIITGSCFFFLVLILGACNKDEQLTPSTLPVSYVLPQGNNAYDDQIVAFYDKYKSYILYKYDTIDYRYNFTGNLLVQAGLPNESYIQESLDFLHTQCFNFYPEEFLKKTMPYKIILASYLDSLVYVGTHQPHDIVRSVTNMTGSRSMMLFGWTDSLLSQKTPEERRQIKAYLNRYYFYQALQSGALKVPDFFPPLTPAGGYGSVPNNFWRVGLVEKPQTSVSNIPWDFLCFIDVITGHTKAELDATILRPTYDISGLIRKKYEGIINYYKNEHGFDLQAIGEAP